MKAVPGKDALTTILIVPTAIVVLMLAFVQYRWSAQVSSATSVRLADSLTMSMMSWHQNLFRNLSDVGLRMRLDADPVDAQVLERTARRFGEQQASAEYPTLASEVDVLPSDPMLPGLQWNRSTVRFDPVPNSPRLKALQARLARDSGLTVATTDSAVPGYAAGSLLGDWRFEPDVPALVHPIATEEALFQNVRTPGRTTAAWVVIWLDTAVIGERMLPELARRYFSGIDGLDYQVALVAGTRPRRVIYSSDSTFAVEDPVDADGRMNMFGRPLEGAAGPSLYVFQKPTDGVGLPIALNTPWFPLVGQTPPEDDWQLIVRHRRGGALGAFVADTRRRDLAISFGLLLLLLLSMTVWIIVISRAQRLARMQMNFVTAVSHDLRTPLTIITSAADNITHGVVLEPRQLAQYGTVIGHQARKLSELVEHVLLFASVREPAHRYSLRPVDVSGVIETTLEASAELIQAQRVVVERHIEHDLPSVLGDPLGLSQCLQNLIANALKYAGDQRWLGVRAEVSKNESSPEIQVSIADRGKGIASSDLPHIFEPFYRSPSVPDEIHGTGLGLAVARSVAEAMNGRLTVVSVPGQGSTFTLHLPCS